MDPIISIRQATKRYGSGGPPAIDRLDLEIRRGEITAITGPSGGGKSTLLNLLAGLDSPTDGAVTVAGVRVDQLSARHAAEFRRTTVGFIFQFFFLLEDLTVLDNVRLPALIAGVDEREATDRAAALLAQLGVAHLAGRFPGSLSGGERQRAAIARALVNRPPILLADEPTGALDSHHGEVVADALRDLGRAGQTVVLVTHDLALSEGVADRLVRLVDGRVREDLRRGSRR